MERRYTKPPWKWGIMDFSMAVLHGEDLMRDSIMSVGPCMSCISEVKKEEDPKWEWGRCGTPNKYDALLIESAPTLLEGLDDIIKIIDDTKKDVLIQEQALEMIKIIAKSRINRATIIE